MKRIHHVASVVRNRLLRTSVKSKTAKLDPALRVALAEDVQQQDISNDLNCIEQELEQAQKMLKESEEKETFLGQRSRQYRKALDERARLLKEERERLLLSQQQEGRDEEQVIGQEEELEQKMEQWEKDEDALTQIVETHKQILGHCESMRWKIKELEKKRKAIRAMQGECQEFLAAATEEEPVHEQQGRSDMEMSSLLPSQEGQDGESDGKDREDEDPEMCILEEMVGGSEEKTEMADDVARESLLTS